MLVALRDVRVRGEIHTIIDYAADMLQVRARQLAGPSQVWAVKSTTCTLGAAYICMQVLQITACRCFMLGLVP